VVVSNSHNVNMAPQVKYDSKLLKELSGHGVLELCYPNTHRPHFLLDLDKGQIHHTTIENLRSFTYELDIVATTDDRVVIYGKMKSGRNNWTVVIVRKQKCKSYTATVTMAGVTFADRVIAQHQYS
jgi:hypothetical protein